VLAAIGLGLAPASPEKDPRLQEADRVLRRGEYDHALSLASAVLAEASQRREPAVEVVARLLIADVHFYRGQLDDYRRDCEGALAVARQAGDEGAIARSLYSLSYVYERTTPARMLEILSEARVHAERSGDAAVRMRIHNAIGTAAWGLGRYALAHEHFELARALAHERGDENNEGVALANLGLVEQARGDVDSAQQVLERALPLLERNRNVRVQGNVLATLADGRAALGDLEGSLALRERGLALWRKVGHKRGEAAALEGLADVEHQLGRDARAESLFDQALRIARELDDVRRSVFLLMDLGELFVDEGQLEKAEPRLREALRRADALGDPLLQARVHLRLAALQAAAGRPEEGLRAADRARSLATTAGERWTEGRAWAARAEALESLGRLRGAREAWTRAIALHEAAHATRYLHVWNGRLARLLARAGDDAAAEARWRASLRLTEQLERLVAIDRFRLRLFDEVAAVFHAYAGWLAEHGRTDDAWRVLDQGRARDLRLRIAQAGAAAPLSPAERDALSHLSELQRRLSETASRPERERLSRSLEDGEADYERARREAAAAAPRAASRPEDAVLALAPSELLVQYAVDGDRLLVFSRRGQRDAAFRVVPNAAALLERARRFREAAAAAFARPFAANQESRALYELLLGPELRGTGITHVTLVPDSDLYGLPFPALRTPGGAWLVERVVLSQAPSPSTLAELRGSRADTARARVLAIAETQSGHGRVPGRLQRLPAAEAEAREVARGSGSRVLVDPGEAAVKSLAFADYAVVHFASHALIDERRGDRSGLVLARQPGEDGLLQAREIYRLSMPVRLVVMSSCRSGAGPELPGEGLVGLPHALFAAGAHSVVATLWDVSDTGSAELMKRFYDALATRPVDEALTAAQRSLLRSRRWSEPGHWAGYVLHGDGGQLLHVPRRSRTLPWLLSGVALFGLLAAALFARHRMRRQAGGQTSA
jgi:CHAT domain-containing protein/predicted negative regulator of RcsB-dependent stress response